MAEAVGLVLGVLPLAIEVAKRYKSMYKAFMRYRHCGSEVTEFQRRLHVEQTAFLNELQILLASQTNFDTANRILAEKTQALELDPEADERFARHLGESGVACEGIIVKIESKLSSIEKFLEKSVPDESSRDYFIRTKRKLKFTFSSSHLGSSLDELARLNAEFLRISNQINRLKHIQVDTGPVIASPKSKYRAGQYEAVRQASIQLFNALGKACSIHPEHWAQVQVEPEHVTAANGEPPLIRFIMAFMQNLMTDKTTQAAPVWVAIESILSNSLADETPERREVVQNAFSHLKMTLKRVNQTPSTPTKKLKTSKGVRFVSPEPEQRPKDNTCTTIGQKLDTTLPDFLQDHNFCVQLQQYMSSKQDKSHACIGFLGKGNTCKHHVFSHANVIATEPTRSMSLARLIDLMSQRSYTGKLLQYESLRLARQLASAVLQFHATPLLKSSWRSDDVIFFGINESQPHHRVTLMSPHLSVQVKDEPPGHTITRTHSNSLARGSLIGNPYLFGLGVVLIELAYQAPLRSLRSEQDLEDGVANLYTDFRTAERLATNIGKELGRTYGKIVRQCLFCDFGQGTKDLGEPILQAAFHRDVLCELEQLEIMMKQFQIGD